MSPAPSTPYSAAERLGLRLRRAWHRRMTSFSDQPFDNEACPACGQNEGLRMAGVLWPELVLQWRLSADWANWMDQREGLRCRACGSNLRSRHVASVILRVLGDRHRVSAASLKALCQLPALQALRVAEINAAGHLHQFLKLLPGLRYSEYGSTQPDIPSEDLNRLSYPDASFDLVVTSDVLEHVPDFERALSEIHRILVPGGAHVFSLPVVWSQPQSRRRATIEAGALSHLLPPSHHGAQHADQDDFLVFHEFGADVLARIQSVGFALETVRDPRSPALATFIATRPAAG